MENKPERNPKLNRSWLLTSTILAGCLWACSSSPTDNPTYSQVAIQMSKFDSLKTEHYEAWVVHQSTYASLGKFNLRFNGDLIDLTGTPITGFTSPVDLGSATRVAVTVEAPGDSDAIPSAMEILSGVVSGTSFALELPDDFKGRAGNVVIITPSDGGGLIFSPAADTSNPFCGVWFVSKPWGHPEFGMTLLAPPAGWTYEGWLMHPTHGFISTGRFADVTRADLANPYLADLDTATVNRDFQFPGEDFLTNQPPALPPGTFPLDVRGSMVFVTLEPEPDNSPLPYLPFTIFCKTLDPAFQSNLTYPMDTPPLPSGTANLK